MASSSDFIKYKKNSIQLRNAKSLAQKKIGSVKYPEFSPVLEQKDYINFQQFNLETTVSNTKNAYSKLIPTGKQEVFRMVRDISNCSGFQNFTMCNNTNTRPNRVLNYGAVDLSGVPVCRKRPLGGIKPFKNKIFKPNTCVFINGYSKRTCLCTSLLCKCKTKVCSQPTSKTSKTAYDSLTFRI